MEGLADVVDAIDVDYVNINQDIRRRAARIRASVRVIVDELTGGGSGLELDERA